MSDFKAKIHQIRFPLTVPQDPSLYLRGPTSKGREGKGERGREGEGRGIGEGK